MKVGQVLDAFAVIRPGLYLDNQSNKEMMDKKELCKYEPKAKISQSAFLKALEPSNTSADDELKYLVECREKMKRIKKEHRNKNRFNIKQK